MDRKSIVILVLSLLLLMAWYPLMNRLYPPKPVQRPAAIGATNEFATNAAASPAATASPAAVPPTPAPPLPAFVTASAEEELVVFENEQARYTFTSHGGGLKSVELKQYPEEVKARGKGQTGTNGLATLNDAAPVPALTLIGREPFQGDGLFQVRKTASGVVAEKKLTNGLWIIKTFAPSTNYLLTAKITLENHSDQSLTLPSRQFVLGTATPIGANDDPSLMGVFSYNGKKAEHIGATWFENRTLGCLPGTPRSEYASSEGHVVWAAVHSRFFAVLAMPKEPAPGLHARRIELPALAEAAAANSRKTPPPFGFQTAFVYPGTVLSPGGTVEHDFTIFAGPRQYNTLARLGHDWELVMDFGLFGFFAKILLLSMNGLNSLGLGYGLAIVVITVIIKILFWPLTQASTRSMKRMSALQPQMKALQEKYKDDPKKMNQKLMEFMKEHKVSPLGGCLPMLVQIPFFFGFFTMLRTAIELRGARFLWAHDLSMADTVWMIPGLSFPLNPLPLVMGATMLWQARLTPPSPGIDPMQQKIMKYMPLMFMVFLYNYSAGLTLYWTVQNLLTIAQTKLTKTITDPSGTPAKKPGPVAKHVPPRKKGR